jgi:hypothetical protein
MKTVTEKDAIELACAFAEFTNIRPSELDTVDDVKCALWDCKRLKRILKKTSIDFRQVARIDKHMDSLKSLQKSLEEESEESECRTVFRDILG